MRYYNHLWVFVQKKKKKTEPAPKTEISTTTVMGPYFSCWHTPSKILFMALHRGQTKGRTTAFLDANCIGLDILAKANYAVYEPFEIVEHSNKARGLDHLKARQPEGPNRLCKTL
jgi:hypothetical protein